MPSTNNDGKTTSTKNVLQKYSADKICKLEEQETITGNW